MNPNLAARDRITVRTPTASGDEIAAWSARPSETEPTRPGGRS